MAKENKTKHSIFTGSVKIDKIKNFMIKNNLTESAFAEKCHLQLSELQKVLDDYSCYEPIWLVYIARAMRVEFEDIIN